MATDGEVRINTKLDTSGVDQGVNDLKKKLDSAEKSIDSGSKKTKAFSQGLKGITTTAAATVFWWAAF